MILEKKSELKENNAEEVKEIKAAPKEHAFELIKPNGVIVLRLGKIS